MKTILKDVSKTSLLEAAHLLEKGEVVAVPTETVYGLAADATNPVAVAKIYQAKGRPSDNPLIVHVRREFGSVDSLIHAGIVGRQQTSHSMREISQKLMDRYWPGPLTIVLPVGGKISSATCAGLGTVGIRMPFSPALLELLNQISFPLAAPSANRSNRISPTTAEHVLEELGGKIPYILDAGHAKIGVESTIVKIESSGRVILLRPGGIPAESIEATLGHNIEALELDGKANKKVAPGQSPVHYAPSKPVYLQKPDVPIRLSNIKPGSGLGVILFSNTDSIPTKWQPTLDNNPVVKLRTINDSQQGNIAANRLFDELREFDSNEKVGAIVVENPAKHFGLWPAIKDRLRRAANNRSDFFAEDM